MNGQVQSSRERFGGFAPQSWITSILTSEHVTNIQKIPPEHLPVSDDEQCGEANSKVKKKLLSMWNNVKYGWTVKIKTNFSKESPVWLLGTCYHKKCDEILERASEATGLDMEIGSEVSLAIDAMDGLQEGMDSFKRDFTSRLWLTYRKEFPILNGSNFTTDCGWGCMLRSGQMMLGQALVCHFLGRGWRWKPELTNVTPEQMEEERKHRMIIKWFGDQTALQSPFSIHSLVSVGISTGKRAGDWYGPGSVAHMLSQAVENASDKDALLDDLRVYVAQDCAVYIEDVRKVCEKPDESWRSLVLLVPLRLGADKLNPSYAPCLTSLLSLESCIGVIGGRPKHALYFIGYQDDKLIHLDPHYCQETVDVLKNDFSLTTFHCTSPRKMLLSKMDPSCCVGFYLANKAAFFEFVEVVRTVRGAPIDQFASTRSHFIRRKTLYGTSVGIFEEILIPPKVDYPMFIVCEGSGNDVLQRAEEENLLASTSISSDNGLNGDNDDNHYECEEFEIL